MNMLIWQMDIEIISAMGVFDVIPTKNDRVPQKYDELKTTSSAKIIRFIGLLNQ